VVLPPESQLLGRASRATESNPRRLVPHVFSQRLKPTPADPDRYGGDLGLGAVVNAHEPPATTLVARPEWIGETGATLEGTLSRNTYGEWLIADGDVQVETIAGVPLDYSIGGDQVTYWPVGHKNLSSGPFRQYLSAAVAGASGDTANFIDVWKSPSALAAAAGEAVRTALHADVAIVPDDLIDEDALGWLEHALASGRTDWLSRFVLERAVFRSYRFVRADVAGSVLLDTLRKALADPLDTGSKACAVGLGMTECPATIATTHLHRIRIRGRAIVPTVYYTVALPDTVAEKLDLEHEDDIEDSVDSLDTLHDFLAAARWQTAAAAVPPLPGVFEHRARNEVRHYLRVPTAELGFSRMSVHQPSERAGVLPNLPVDFSGAKPERTLTAKVEADWAIVEKRRQAWRIVGRADFGRREVLKEGRPSDVTYPKDEFFTGIRYEARIVTRTGAFEWRPYVGGFIEGPFRTSYTTDFTASRPAQSSRDGFVATEVAGFPTPLRFEPSRYLHGTIGLDVLPAAADVIALEWLDAQPTRLGISQSYGSQSKILVDLALGGEPQAINDFLAQGAGALLNAYFERTAATFSRDVVWKPIFESRTQQRTQLDIEGELRVNAKDDTYKFGVAVQFRRYKTEKAEDLALATSWKTSLKVTIPVYGRFEFVPAWEYQASTINADENNRFSANRFELRLNLPLFMRFGSGKFFQ